MTDVEIVQDEEDDGEDLEQMAGQSPVIKFVNYLISNAIKYSYPETTVTVGLIPPEKSDDNSIIIYVKDEGQGIPKDELGKLFEPFTKISVEATAGEKSTGLGLAITKKIVEAHGGSIEVETTVGEGSTFYVELPHE